MRVVAGTARSIPLLTPEGKGTRPTTDRIKETLFNIIQADCPNARVLDLFAGSGALGIEALSRGAAFAVFSDSSADPVRCITANLNKTRFAEKAQVIKADYETVIKRLSAKKDGFDLVFLDPPYGMGLELDAMRKLTASGLLNDDALIVIEEAKEHQLSLSDLKEISGSLGLARIKEYKTNKHYFIRFEKAFEKEE